jgi:hypothetical protein
MLLILTGLVRLNAQNLTTLNINSTQNFNATLLIQNYLGELIDSKHISISEEKNDIKYMLLRRCLLTEFYTPEM